MRTSWRPGATRTRLGESRDCVEVGVGDEQVPPEFGCRLASRHACSADSSHSRCCHAPSAIAQRRGASGHGRNRPPRRAPATTRHKPAHRPLVLRRRHPLPATLRRPPALGVCQEPTPPPMRLTTEVGKRGRKPGGEVRPKIWPPSASQTSNLDKIRQHRRCEEAIGVDQVHRPSGVSESRLGPPNPTSSTPKAPVAMILVSESPGRMRPHVRATPLRTSGPLTDHPGRRSVLLPRSCPTPAFPPARPADGTATRSAPPWPPP